MRDSVIELDVAVMYHTTCSRAKKIQHLVSLESPITIFLDETDPGSQGGFADAKVAGNWQRSSMLTS